MNDQTKFLFIGFFVGSLICGIIWGITGCTNQAAIDQREHQYQSTIASYQAASDKAKSGYRDLQAAIDGYIKAEESRDSRNQTEINAIGSGSRGLESAIDDVITAVQRHGQSLDKLP